MEYKTYTPPPALQNYIRYFWSFDSWQSNTNILHIKSFADKYPRLVYQNLHQFNPICNLEGRESPMCYISGIDTLNTDTLMGGTFSHFGVSFYPHALHAFFGVDAFELINQIPAIQQLIGTDIHLRLDRASSHQERVALLCHFFYERLYAAPKQEQLVAHIVKSGHINCLTNVYELTKQYHVSERQLERKFKTAVGISPKKYQRLIRFEKALQLLNQADYKQLTAIAYQLNYTDQSHFIKDFRSFSGMSPYEFIKNHNLGSESSSFIYLAD